MLQSPLHLFVQKRRANDLSLVWEQKYETNDRTKFGSQAIGVAVDAQGNVYVTGSHTVPDDGRGHNDIVTLKYSKDGEFLGGRVREGEPADGFGFRVAVGPGGAFYVTGQEDIRGDDELNQNIWTTKYCDVDPDPFAG